MRKINILIVMIFATLALVLVLIQPVQAITELNKGINITDWLDTDEDYHVQTTRYTKTDFQDIQSLGCDHVRILVNFDTGMNTAPEYEISSIFYNCLDRALGWASDVGLKVVIANSGHEITDLNFEQVQEQIVANWRNVATKYAGLGDVVLYEIQAHTGTEISAENWNTVAAAVIAGIREVDANHTIVVGPVNNYSLESLSGLTKFDDDNVLYAFEFFDPVLFTRQGVSYMDIDYNTIVIPFPYDAASMPSMDAADAGTAAEDAYNNYATTGTVDYVKQRIDLAAQYATDNGVSMWCASLGTTIGTNYNYDKEMGWYVPEEDRGTWLETVHTYMESKGISWCLAGFRGNYGIFDNYEYDPDTWMKNSVFDYDVNTATTTALGLTAPPEAEYDPEALSEGFVIYDDKITELARVGWWLGDGEPNFFVEEEEEAISGEYCLGIFYPGQYNAVDFFFPEYLDMEDLANDEYLLDFFILCYDAEAHIQARFEDTNEDLDDRPWRMNYNVDNNVVPFDGDWQRVTIALTDMDDQGAWDPDDRIWYGGGLGEYEWARVQRLQFVSETREQPETEIFIDRVRIVHPTAVEDRSIQKPDIFRLEANYPNPFNPSTKIGFSIPTTADVKLSIYNINGELVRTLALGVTISGNHEIEWDGKDRNDRKAPSGIYFYELTMDKQRLVRQMVLIR